jgi:hypothetical protein
MGLFRPVTGLLYLYLQYNITGQTCLFYGLYNDVASNSDYTAPSGRESEQLRAEDLEQRRSGPV